MSDSAAREVVCKIYASKDSLVNGSFEDRAEVLGIFTTRSAMDKKVTAHWFDNQAACWYGYFRKDTGAKFRDIEDAYFYLKYGDPSA